MVVAMRDVGVRVVGHGACEGTDEDLGDTLLLGCREEVVDDVGVDGPFAVSDHHDFLALLDLLDDEVLVPVQVVLGLVVQEGPDGGSSEVVVELLVFLVGQS